MFPGASAGREAADYVLVGAPLEASTSFRPGARFGPDRLRQFARGFEDYDPSTGQRFTDLAVHDHGDVSAWADAREYLDYLRSLLEEVVRDGAVPFILGGEHTVTVAGVEAVDPEVFVAFDAHLDLRESLGGDPWSHSTVTRHALEVADRAVILGARAGSEAEWDRAADSAVEVVSPEAVPEWEPDFRDERVYVSLDIDVVDPAYAPGTGTPEPFGLTSRELRRALCRLAPQAAGFDVVEVNDRDDGQAATLGAKLLREAIFAHADA